MTTEFDALKYAHRLEAAGVPTDQAAVHAQVLSEVVLRLVPAKHLLEMEGSLRHEISETESRLSMRIDMVKTELLAKLEVTRVELDAKIDRVRVDLEAKIDRLRVDLEAKIDKLRIEFDARLKILEADIKLIKWVVGFQTALSIAILVRLFIP